MGQAPCGKHFADTASPNPGNGTLPVGKPKLRERAVCPGWSWCERSSLNPALPGAWAPCLLQPQAGPRFCSQVAFVGVL